MDHASDNVIDGIERAEHWRRRRPALPVERSEPVPQAPKSIAASLLLPGAQTGVGPTTAPEPRAGSGAPSELDGPEPALMGGIAAHANPFLLPQAEVAGNESARATGGRRIIARLTHRLATRLAGSRMSGLRSSRAALGGVRPVTAGVAAGVAVIVLAVLAPWSVPRSSSTDARAHRSALTTSRLAAKALAGGGDRPLPGYLPASTPHQAVSNEGHAVKKITGARVEHALTRVRRAARRRAGERAGVAARPASRHKPSAFPGRAATGADPSGTVASGSLTQPTVHGTDTTVAAVAAKPAAPAPVLPVSAPTPSTPSTPSDVSSSGSGTTVVKP